MLLADKLPAALAEVERQVVEDGLVQRSALLPVLDYGWTKRDKRLPIPRWVVLIRKAWEVSADELRTIDCRKALALAYKDGLLPERQWPAVELAACATDDGVHLITDPCPYCGKRHTHGTGGPGRPVLWGHRVPHCAPMLPSCYGQYILVPKAANK